MKITTWVSAIALLAAMPAFAEDEATETESDASKQVKDALKGGADAPKTPPTLPDEASDRAKYVHENIAFGKNGQAHRQAAAEASKAAKAEGAAKANQHAADARSGAATRSTRGAAAASAARSMQRGRR